MSPSIDYDLRRNDFPVASKVTTQHPGTYDTADDLQRRLCRNNRDREQALLFLAALDRRDDAFAEALAKKASTFTLDNYEWTAWTGKGERISCEDFFAVCLGGKHWTKIVGYVHRSHGGTFTAYSKDRLHSEDGRLVADWRRALGDDFTLASSRVCGKRGRAAVSLGRCTKKGAVGCVIMAYVRSNPS